MRQKEREQRNLLKRKALMEGKMMRGENNQEKEKQIMVNKKELNDQEKQK